MVQKPVLNNVKKGTGQREVRPVWNNAMRVNHKNFSNSRRNFVRTTVLTKSGIVPVSAARLINTAAPKSFINSINAAKGNRVTSAVGEQGINAVKSSVCLTATVEIVNDGEQHITVIVDGQTIAITEASVRRHLQLADVDGISSLPNTKIFEQLTLIGYVSNGDKLTFQKGEHIPLFDSMLIHDQPGQGEGPTLTVESQHTPIASPTTSQPTTSQPMSSQEQPSQEVTHLEVMRAARNLIVETEYEEVEYELDQTDTFQQITPTKVSQGEEQSKKSSEVQLDVLSAAKILADASRERVKTYKSYTRKRRSTVSSRDSTAGAEQVQERQLDTIKRYQTLKKKPVSIAQARKNMMIYLKNMAEYKMGYFKGMSYDEIRPMFEKEYNKIQTLFKKDTEVEKTKTKRVAEETLLQESFKKLRTTEASRSEPIQEQPTEEPKELSKEELKKMLEIVPVEEIKAEALQVKEDLVTLWSLVKERFRSAEPTEDMERALWVELKRLFEPDKDDVLWKLQKYMHDPLT
ncbi:hypothetical protein Tco_0474990 [Tanacetum coccineum]